MPKPINADPGIKVTTMIPLSMKARIDLHLFSELEQGIPSGSLARFVKLRVTEFFDSEALDLAPYIAGIMPGSLSVRGTPAAVAALREKLEKV